MEYLGRTLQQDSTLSQYEDDFPMDYETGYRLFASLACMLGFLFACIFFLASISYVQRRDEGHIWSAEGGGSKRHVCVLLCLLCIGAAVSLIVWGGTARPDEEKYSDGLAAIIIGALILVGCICCLTHCLRRVGFCPQTSPLATLLAVSVPLYFLLIPGLVLMAIYCKKMIYVEEHECFGEMIVLDSKAIIDKGYRCGRGSVCNGYKGQVQLSWNATCDAPSDDSVEVTRCNAWTIELDCTRHICEWNENACSNVKTDAHTAISETERCLKDRYLVAGNTITAYGTCSYPCKVTLDIPISLALTIKKAGKGLSIVGIVLVLVLPLAVVLYRLTCIRSKRHDRVSETHIHESCTNNERSTINSMEEPKDEDGKD